MPSYFVAVVAAMPGVYAEQNGVFYSVANATSSEDACQQIAQQIVAAGVACPPFMITTPGANVTACNLTSSVTATSVATPVPSAPTLNASADSQGNVTLTWTAEGPANQVGYVLERGTVSGGPYTPIVRQFTTGYTDPTLAAGTYYYVVLATNLNGAAQSAQVAVTIP